MPIQNAYGQMLPSPTYFYGQVLGPSSNSFAIDAAAEKVGLVFRAPKAGNLARVIFRTGTVTTGDTLKVSFQDVDLTTGNPDGGADQFRTQVIADNDDGIFVRTGIISADGTDGGAKRAVAAGDLVSVVIEFNSFVAGNLNIVGCPVFGTRGPFVGTHYLTHFTASWAKSLTTLPLLAVEYDDGTFAFLPGCLPGVVVATQSVSSSTTPDEVGIRIVLPFKARVWGAWVSTSLAGDVDLVLYDAASAVVGSGSMDKDVSSLSSQTSPVHVPFTQAPTLLPNVAYRLVLKPTSTTAVTIPYMDVHTTPGAAILDQMDGGQAIHWTQRTDAGAWSETTTRRPVIGLIFSGLDDGDNTRGGRMHVITSKRRRRLNG